MTGDLYYRFVVALAALLALLAGFAWLARRFGPLARGVRGGLTRRLAVVEITPIDGASRSLTAQRFRVETLRPS